MDSTSLLDQLSGYWSALDQHPILHAGLAFGLLLVGALILGRVARYIVLYAANLLARQPALHWLGDLIRNKVFQRLAQTTPSLLVQFGLPWIPEMPDKAAHFLGNLALAFTVLFLILALTALLNALLDIYARTEHARTRSIKGYVQLAKIAVFVFGAIIIVSIIIDRSPLLLLSGLGAMSAVLLLVYKDTLMSFVASVQLTSNDMLRVGDWIEIPDIGVDGDVIDIALHTVKVQNWDKTISTVPTHRLISNTFRNWRGMSEAGGRRIKRALHIDATSVRFLDEGELRRFGTFEPLADYMRSKTDELAAWNAERPVPEGTWGDPRRLTNLGTFRAYVATYLHRHPGLATDRMTALVRLLGPTPEGVPLEIYVFTADTDWILYEGIQSDLLDHLLAILPEFGLRLFQAPSGSDVRFLSS